MGNREWEEFSTLLIARSREDRSSRDRKTGGDGISSPFPIPYSLFLRQVVWRGRWAPTDMTRPRPASSDTAEVPP